MTSVLISTTSEPGAPELSSDLNAAGIDVVGESNCTDLLRDVLIKKPDLIVMHDNSPHTGLFDCVSAVRVNAPRPFVVFTTDQDAEKIEQATRAGVHAYVVNGYSPVRLRSVIHLAQARFRHDQLLRDELQGANQKFDERTLVDRAKGILMGARQMREADAYRALRTAAMHTSQRIGQISQQVIESARYGEAINRAGQLRMLSQRVVKLYALECADIAGADTAGLMADSISLVENNFSILKRSLSQQTFGDLVAAVLVPWKTLKIALAAPRQADRLIEIDRLAEIVLKRAEQLTVNLEISGLAAALHVINISGRQRMLSQRVAKYAMIACLVQGKDQRAAIAAIEKNATELEDGLAYLSGLSLTNAAIDQEIAAAVSSWSQLRAAIAGREVAANRQEIAALSEALLGQFGRLTDHFERGLQALI